MYFQIYRSAIKNKVLDKMTLISNGIDEVRRNATMYIDLSNNGGSGIERINTYSGRGNNQS